jgi:O-antigen biosynthesis protein WbqP
MKRFFDFFIAFILIVILLIPIILIAILIRLNSKGATIHWSKRVGKNEKIFLMPKFRSMSENAPIVATDLMPDPDLYLSSFGKFIRKYSLDEIPQLFSILKGDMSLVGPRPALFNQDDLIEMRRINGINKLIPGITGWAQINGRDNISLIKKVELDEEYLTNQSFLFDLKIIIKTLIKIINKEGVTH